MEKKETVNLLFDFLHRSFMHHALWFSEVRRQLGDEKAYALLNEVWNKSLAIQLERFSKIAGVNINETLSGLPQDKLDAIRDAIAVNWLATDGIWFQAVEFSRGMNDAKRCNDSCWAQFSPFEAKSIKAMLGLEEKPGLEGLKKALNLRLYAYINEQEITDEYEDSFIFRMKRCRVQAARNRKGLSDYPCKSGGLVEYTTFAETIDSRIKTECIACPPDIHPEEWYCAWRFSLNDK